MGQGRCVSVVCFSHTSAVGQQYENLSWEPQNQHTKPGAVVYIPRAGKAKTGGLLELVASQPRQSVNYRFSEKHCLLKN